MNMRSGVRVAMDSVLAGIMISLGGTVFLACENRYVGAVFFSVGLFATCARGLPLFTGRSGYLLESLPTSLYMLVLIWVCNFVGSAAVGIGVAYAHPAFAEKAAGLCAAKLTQSIPATLFLGVMCGLLVYIAVDHYKTCTDGMGKYLGILLCVPVFILSGFEHIVADMFYFAVGGVLFSALPQTLFYLLFVTIGNVAGTLILPVAAIGRSLPPRKGQ